MKNHKFYYYDEQKDDFANTKIKGKQTPPDYQYLPQRLSYRIFKPIVYYAVLFLLEVFWIFFRQVPIKNRKVLRNRKEKKKGYFVYGNHTLWVTDAISAPVSVFPRQCYTIAHPDAISIPGLFTLVRMLGALPVPSAVGAYRNFLSAVEKLYQKGCVIACEWSENIENALPENTVRIYIERGEHENQRNFRIEGFGEYEDFIC